MDTRKVSLDVYATNGPHAADMVGSLCRVAQCVNLIVAARPVNPDKLLRLLVRAEIEIDGITMPEIEYASYLAGMADRTR